MKTKDRKLIQKQYANENLQFFFSLLETRFRPSFDNLYIKEIQIFSKSFNIRLTREQKLKFCKNCNIFWDTNSKEIRLNSKLGCMEHICKNCGFIRRFKYKN